MREFDTDRLFFRLPTLTNFDDFSAMRSDPVVMRHIDLPEAGWMLSSVYHGMGYGSEGVEAA